jgi:hypothetical protein
VVVMWSLTQKDNLQFEIKTAGQMMILLPN